MVALGNLIVLHVRRAFRVMSLTYAVKRCPGPHWWKASSLTTRPTQPDKTINAQEVKGHKAHFVQRYSKLEKIAKHNLLISS